MADKLHFLDMLQLHQEDEAHTYRDCTQMLIQNYMFQEELEQVLYPFGLMREPKWLRFICKFDLIITLYFLNFKL